MKDQESEDTDGARRARQFDAGSCALCAVAHQQSSRHRLDERSRIGNAHLVLRERDDASKSCPGKCPGFIGEAGAERGHASAKLGQDRSACCGEAAAGSGAASGRNVGHAASRDSSGDGHRPSLAYGAPPPKTPAQLTLERQLSGAVFSQSSSPMAPAGGTTPPVAAPGAGRAEHAAAAQRHDRG